MSNHQLPPLLIPLLKHLSDGRFHSGQDLANVYEVSRATIFNLIHEAGKQGVRIHAVRGKGYLLADPMAWLVVPELDANLQARGLSFHVQTLPEVDSTNSHLLVLAANGALHRTVLYADSQYGGRGRRGRNWQAPLGGSLAFSVLWRFDCGVSQLSGLSVVIGLALARALTGFCNQPVKVKWPNDILVGYRKLAGILVEVQGELSGPSFAVIGIGVNRHLSAAVREDIDQAVIDLQELGVQASQADILGAILAQLDADLTRFQLHGLQSTLEQWPAWHVHEGREVQIRMPDGMLHQGRAQGLDELGNLLLSMPDGQVRKFGVGEVSLRLVNRAG